MAVCKKAGGSATSCQRVHLLGHSIQKSVHVCNQSPGWARQVVFVCAACLKLGVQYAVCVFMSTPRERRCCVLGRGMHRTEAWHLRTCSLQRTPRPLPGPSWTNEVISDIFRHEKKSFSDLLCGHTNEGYVRRWPRPTLPQRMCCRCLTARFFFFRGKMCLYVCAFIVLHEIIGGVFKTSEFD